VISVAAVDVSRGRARDSVMRISSVFALCASP
jgi:hypothetical protein